VTVGLYTQCRPSQSNERQGDLLANAENLRAGNQTISSRIMSLLVKAASKLDGFDAC